MNIEILRNGSFFAIVDSDNVNDSGEVYLIINGSTDWIEQKLEEGETYDLLEMYQDLIENYKESR